MLFNNINGQIRIGYGNNSVTQPGEKNDNSGEISSIDAQIESLDEDIVSLTSEQEEESGQLESSQSELSGVESQITDIQGAITTAEGNVSAAQSELSAAQNIPGEQITNEDGTVTIDYSKRDAAIAAAQAKLAEAQAQLEAVKEQLAELREQHSEVAEQIEEINAQIAEDEAQIVDIQSQISELESEKETLQEEAIEEEPIDQTQSDPQEIDILSYTQERENINAQDSELRQMYAQGDEEGVKAFFDELYSDNPLMAQAKYQEFTQEQEFFEEVDYLTRWQSEDFTSLMDSLSVEEQDKFFEIMDKNSDAPIGRGVTSPDEFDAYMQNKFIEFYGEELGQEQFEAYQKNRWDINGVQSSYQRDTIDAQLNDTQLNEQAVFNDIDENIDLNKLRDASSVEEVLDILESYTNEEAARLIFNGICSDESFIQATGIESMSINEEGKLIINGQEVDISEAPNPLQDKKDVIKNALFDFRNGQYVVSESVLTQLSNNSVQYDDQGNMLSSKEYFVDEQGNLSFVDVKYNYDDAGNSLGFTKTGYDEAGNVSYTDDYIFGEENGQASFSFIRKDAQGNTVSEFDNLSPDKITELNDLYAKARKYTSRLDLTYDELLQIDTIDYLTSKNSDVEELLMNQDYEDGIISKAYNKGKELFGSSLSRQNIYEQMVQNVDNTNALIEAINNPDVSFEETYKSIYGVDYDQEAIDAVKVAEAEIQLYASNAEQINQNDALLSKAYQDGDFELLERMFDTIYSDDPDKAHEAYQQYLDEQSFLKEVDYLERWQSYNCQYGALMMSLSSEEEAAELEAAKNNNPGLPVGSGTVTKDEYDAYMQNKFIEFYGEEVGREKYAQFTSSYPGNIQNVTSSYRDQTTLNLKNNLAALGIDSDNISENFSNLNEQAFGTSQSIDLTDLVTEYVQDQQQFVDKASSALQTVGTVIMVGGALVAIPLSGGTSASALPYLMAAKGVMTAGRYMAMIGTFGGDALHLADELTSENCSEADLNYILKDAAIDAAMHISGRLIGKVSNGVHDLINQHTEMLGGFTQGVIGYGTEIAVDAPLSLLADYAITGDVSLTSEGRSQLISLITGIAGERINNIQMKIAGAAASAAVRPGSDNDDSSDGGSVKPTDGEITIGDDSVPKTGAVLETEDEIPKTEAPETDDPQTAYIKTQPIDEAEAVKTQEDDCIPTEKVGDDNPTYTRNGYDIVTSKGESFNLQERFPGLEDSRYDTIASIFDDGASVDDVDRLCSLEVDHFDRASGLVLSGDFSVDNAIKISQYDDERYRNTLKALHLNPDGTRIPGRINYDEEYEFYTKTQSLDEQEYKTVCALYESNLDLDKAIALSSVSPSKIQSAINDGRIDKIVEIIQNTNSEPSSYQKLFDVPSERFDTAYNFWNQVNRNYLAPNNIPTEALLIMTTSYSDDRFQKMLDSYGYDPETGTLSGTLRREPEYEIYRLGKYLDEETFNIARILVDEGFSSYEALINSGDIAKLEPSKYETLRSLYEENGKLYDAIALAKLEPSEYETAYSLYKANVNLEDAIALSSLEPSKVPSAIELLQKGYSVDIIKKIDADLAHIGGENNSVGVYGIPDLDKHWDEINAATHGPRLDSSLSEWTIKVGDQEVSILTDNNMVRQRNIQGLDIDGIRVLTTDQEKAIYDAFQTMERMGQKIPDKIYITDLFVESTHPGTGEPMTAAGIYTGRISDSIFINSIYMNDTSYLKQTIYHESAHLADGTYEAHKSFYSSSLEFTREGKISPNTDTVNIKGVEVPIKDIKYYISDYAASNNAEFVAEVTSLITSGIIIRSRNGNYKINYNLLGKYLNAKGVETTVSIGYKKSFNQIMKLYDILTDNGQTIRGR